MKGWQKLLCRAGTVGGLSFVGKLLESGFPPENEHFYFASLMFLLAFLAFFNTAFENNDYDGDGKSDDDKIRKSEIRALLNKERKSKLKQIVGCFPNLWFP